ncbi:MAG: hypothetical protein M3146_08960 [Thermoproteota archaeon]|nr:hypothetical protein [Thermoproteota archaeon]
MTKEREKNREEKQRQFLNEICGATLYADKKVVFVGVVDRFGKLLVGGTRYNTTKRKTESSSSCIKPDSFFTCLLVSGLEKWEKELNEVASITSTGLNNDSDFHFEVLELDLLKLAITPLTRTGELYLCIYFEPSASSHEVISKICKVI